MPRVAIIFTDKTLKELKDYIANKYGKRRVMSLTVEQAVKEYLDREGKKGGTK